MQSALQLFAQGELLRDYGCCINALRLRMRKQKDLDVELYLLKLADEFKDDPSSYEHALAHLGAFYLFHERDIRLAVDIFNKILASNPRSKAVLVSAQMISLPEYTGTEMNKYLRNFEVVYLSFRSYLGIWS